MTKFSENHIWLSECGTRVIQRKAGNGLEQLNEWERLVYIVWYTDFLFKTVGLIDETRSAHPRFRNEAVTNAEKLSLTVTADTFRLSLADLNAEFSTRLEAICDELRDAEISSIQPSTHQTVSNNPTRVREASLLGQEP